MLKAFWEDNDTLSEGMKIGLYARESAIEQIKSSMRVDYPLGKRVRVETTHKGKPNTVHGIVTGHVFKAGEIELEVENERTGHLRRFGILMDRIYWEPLEEKKDERQAAIDAFMASEKIEDAAL